MQQKNNNHGDIVANTLQYYRERTSSSGTRTPNPYLDIKKELEKTMKEGKRVLIDIRDSYSVQTVVLRFDRVYDRWAKGSSVCYLEGKEVEVPYTIHYSDIICSRMKVKVITEGDNPFEQRH
ncbi:hypothetical protein BSP38_141 [Bacillus phage BSP38]|uniref:Uncharacterized protein n=1 Tax=Bacillus phage BSP38 TaxID=2283013 RepID=A0A345MK01_BPBSP|nr:hypothetical protein HWB82_gp177 [Bacillus phage BSP38]AXH71183.1 hypothetical protein BSP38_141 [Bacillus phage BSP38]